MWGEEGPDKRQNHFKVIQFENRHRHAAEEVDSCGKAGRPAGLTTPQRTARLLKPAGTFGSFLPQSPSPEWLMAAW